MLYDAARDGGWTLMTCFPIGLSLVKVELIAIYTGIGPGRLGERIVVGLVAVLALCVCREMGTAALFRPDPREREFIVPLMVFTWGTLSLGLSIFRLVAPVRLAHNSVPEPIRTIFSLRRLLGVTALISVALTLLVWLDVPWQAWSLWILLAAAIVAALGLMIVIPLMMILLRPVSQRFFWPIANGLLILALFGIPWIAILTFCLGNAGVWLLPLLAPIVAQIGCLIFSLSLLRLAGYDLHVDDVPKLSVKGVAKRRLTVEIEDPWTEAE
ncbi:hypothetical protein [Blastopirellula retiformator]|nr:hypothetical protein [Blastopirellula retiformator]